MPKTIYYTHLQTPAGALLLTHNGQQMTGMYWTVFKRAPQPDTHWIERPDLFKSTIRELEEYFAGTRKTFSTQFQVAGTPFQKAVWNELAKIPYGKTTTYLAIATAIGKPKAVRAVGTAVGSNPVSIAVPCHRVLATSGGLGGYAGGLESKQTLLTLESSAAI